MKSISLEGKDAAIAMTPILSSRYNTSKPDSLPDTISSTTTDLPVKSSSNPSFNAATSLQIQSSGKPPLSFPSAPSALETPIFSPATGRPIYISIRPRRHKGNCRLVRADDASETAVARTTYRWGPGRNPIVRIGKDDDRGAEEFEMVGRRLFDRGVGFGTRRWGRFEWRYGTRGERAEWAADNLLVLERVGDSGGGEGRVKVAQLVRNDALRTPGTNYLAAGNGGRLQMDLVDEMGHEIVDEVVVAVTCLVMLKKEIDRLRTIQVASMSTGGGAPAISCATNSFAKVKSRLKS